MHKHTLNRYVHLQVRVCASEYPMSFASCYILFTCL